MTLFYGIQILQWASCQNKQKNKSSFIFGFPPSKIDKQLYAFITVFTLQLPIA